MFKDRQNLNHFVKYASIGLCGVAVDFAIYTILLGLGRHYIVANIISTIIAIACSFLLNLKFNFKVTDLLKYRFISFFVVGIMGLVLSTVLLKISTNMLDAGPLSAKLISLFFVLIFQYSLNKKITFGNIKPMVAWTRQNKYLLFAAGLMVLCYALAIDAHSVCDEYDNFLGGKYIIEFGAWPYTGFFSHHMPLPYIFGSFLYLIGDDNALILRAVFYAFSGVIIFGNALLLKKYASYRAAIMFVILYAVSILFLGMGRYLSENIAVLFILSMVNLLMYLILGGHKLNLRLLALLSLLLTLTVLTTLNYIYVLLIIVGLIVYLIYKQLGAAKKLRLFAVKIATLAFFPVFAVLILLITHTVKPMYAQAFLFNTDVYSKYAPALGYGPVDTFFGALAANLGFVQNVLIAPFGQTGAFSLLLFATLILLIIALKQNYVLAAGLVLMVLLSNTRSLTGVNDGGVYHFVLMRLLIILLSAYLIDYAIKVYSDRKKLLANAQYLSVSVVTMFLLSAVSFGLASMVFTFDVLNDYGEVPGKKKFIKVTEAETDNTALAQQVQAVINRDPQQAGYFAAPLEFGLQMKLAAKQASFHTFWLPWTADCQECSARLLSDLNSNKPSAIVWSINFTIAKTAMNDHNSAFDTFLAENYYMQASIKNSETKLYVRNDLRIY